MTETEQKAILLAAESERQRRLYETVLSNTPDFVYVFSLDHRVLYANDALIKMWGRGPDGTIGKTFLEIGYEPWHAQMHEREIDEVRATRQPVRGEVPFTGTSGRRHYEYIFVPVIGAHGEVEAVAGTTRDVTERHEADAALRESEERSAFVRRSSGVGFWYCDLPFDVLQWDELVKAHFHLPPDATVTIQTFYERMHPDDRERVRHSIERSIEGHTPYKVDYRTVHPDTGATIWVRAIGRTFYAPDGAPKRFDGVTLDVTDQKRGEERQQFLIRLADTLRPLSDPVEVQAEASRVLGEYLSANRVVYFEIRGDEYVIERDYTAGVQPLAGRYPVATFGPALLAVLLEGRTVIEADATTQPGRAAEEQAAFVGIQVRGHVDVPLVKNGSFVAGMTVHVSDRRDWTLNEIAVIEDTAERTWAAVERTRAERALRESKVQLQALITNLPGGAVFVVDKDLRYLIAEGEAINDAGSKSSDFLGKSIHQALPKDQASAHEAHFRRALSGEHFEVEHAVNGRVFLTRGVPLRSSGDEVHAVLAASFDITERKQAEVEAREADKRKDEFLAMLAHELRNPLAAISNATQVVKRLTLDNTRIERPREVIERQLQHLTRLVDDLLDMSRLTWGKIKLNQESLSLATVLQNAVEVNRPLIDARAQQLTITLPPVAVQVVGDPIRLVQVFGNLLNNAAKYTEAGGHIALHAEIVAEKAVIRVSDDGCGLSESLLPHVFELFTQAGRSLDRAQGGLGLGLALVHSLVKMHGGKVTAHSAGLGKGSQFVVQLPVALGGDECEPPSRNVATAHSTIPSPRLRVLVVEDNPDNGEMLVILLRHDGDDVRMARDGVSALDAARHFQPQVVLCDLGLPGLSGFEVASRLREQPECRGTLMVAISGYGRDDDRRESQLAGFDHHLTKPVDPEVLAALIERRRLA